MDDHAFDAWVTDQRSLVFDYLEAQGINQPNVGEWPAFDVAPYFAIWAIESQKVLGKIGWWAFSGDCPFDYVSNSGECHTRAALKILLVSWNRYIPYMRKGEQPPDSKIGDGENLLELGDLLERRVSVLEGWYEDDDLWEDR
jgi:hypothetical protein